MQSGVRQPHPRGPPPGWKREALKPRVGDLMAFINKDLLPHLHQLDVLPDGQPNLGASAKQRVIGRIMTAAERVRVDSETNLCDILDRVHEISIDHIDDRHFFALSQVYEDLLLKMGEKNSDGGQFFTPREVVRAMVRTLAPQLGETVYDPCCGTGGFLAQAYELMRAQLGDAAAATDIEQLKAHTFYGREKENLVLPIALANLVLHGIDQPRLWHGNTLSGAPSDEALFDGAPATFDVILTNPPFGGKEGRDAQERYAFETSATQVLFMQHILGELSPPMDGRPGGRCLAGGRVLRCWVMRRCRRHWWAIGPAGPAMRGNRFPALRGCWCSVAHRRQTVIFRGPWTLPPAVPQCVWPWHRTRLRPPANKTRPWP